MAMRVHVVAAHGGDLESFAERFATEASQLGGWVVGLASVWAYGEAEADWRASLHSRQHRCPVYRATTVDDAALHLAVFVDGQRAMSFEHPFGGLGDDLLHSFLDHLDEDDEEGRAADLDRALSADELSALEEDGEVDAGLLAALADGHSPRQAARLLALDRADGLARLGREHGVDVHRDLVEAVLVGDSPYAGGEDDPLDAWADAPELLCGAGLAGFRPWLLELDASHEAEEASPEAEIGEAEAEPPRRRFSGRALLGCTALCVPILIGLVAGWFLGGVLGALGGAGLGVVVGIAMVVLAIRSGLRKLKRTFVGEDGLDGLEPLPTAARARGRLLLAAWHDLTSRFGDGGGGGLLGQLYGGVMMPSDPAGRRLVERLTAGEDLSDLEGEVEALRQRLLDAELEGAPLSGLEPDYRRLAESI